MSRTFLYYLMILNLVLTACGENVVVKPTEENIITATESIPTHTLRPTSTPRSKTIMTLTATLNPIEQAGATSYESTQDAQNSSIDATEQARSSLVTKFPKICESNSIYTSPNNDWLAVNCLSDGKFLVTNISGDKIWQIPYELLYDPQYFPYNVGGVFPVNWFQDGRYLYFTKFDCCGDNDLLSYAGPLYRMDLQTGAWIEVVGNGSLNAVIRNAYSFSPTERRLVYIPERPETNFRVYIRDLKTGMESSIEMPEFEQGGRIVWRKDGLQFAMTTVYGNEFDGNKTFSVVSVDLTKNSYKILVREVYPDAFPVSFSDNGILQIALYKYSANLPAYYLETLYYSDGERKFVTPTPRP